jgi:arginase family enzyme
MQISVGSTPDATTMVKGKVQLAGDLGGVGTTSATPLISNNAISNAKLANLTTTSQLKGSSSLSVAAADISLGTNLTISGSILDVNTSSLSGSFLPLTGGTMSGLINQPIAPLNPGDLTNKSYVDGLTTPDATTIVKGKVQLAGDLTGTAAMPTIANLSVSTGKLGDNAVTNLKLANMSFSSQLKGSGSGGPTIADISLGSNLTMTGSTLDVNTSSLSGSFLPLSGGTMSGSINQPIAPTLPNHVTNKSYVDAQIVIGTPDATNLVKGKILLAGDIDPTSTASAPLIKLQGITNPKINPGGASTLKGTNSLTNVDDIILGSGLSLSLGAGPTLTVNSSGLSKAGAAQFGVVEFDASGDLNATAINSGIGVVKPLAITNPKINPGGANTLKGTNALTNVDDIILGSGLSLTFGMSPTLSVDQTVFNKAGASQFGVVEFDASGDLNATAINSGIGVVKPLAITNSKLANLSGMSQLKGSSSASIAATDIILGTGLNIVSNVLNIDTTTLNKAGTTQFGIVEFDSTIGDLTASSANSGIGLVKPFAITNAKLANLSGMSQLKGSSSISTAATDIIIGSGLSMSGNNLFIDVTTIQKAGASQFGVVQFDPALGDLDPTSANSGIGQVKALAISTGKIVNLAVTTAKIADVNVTNPKVNPGGASTLKGTNSLTNVDDIILGSGLSLTAGAGPTLSVNSSALSKAGAAQFGVVQFDATLGDLDPTSANSGIGQVKALAISTGKITNLAVTTAKIADVNVTTAKIADVNVTNPKINPGGASTLKGTNSLTNVDDIILGSGLSLTAGAGPTLSVNSSALSKAGAAQFGVVQFDATLGDLDPTSANSGIGQVKALAISTGKIVNLAVTTAKIADVNVTNPKVNPGGASTLKGTNSLTNVDDIILGSGLSLTAGAGPTLSVGSKTKNSSVVRTLQTSTGAVGFQVSATLPSTVYYSVQISTTIAVGGSSTGTVFLEVAPTNSAVAGDWVVDAQISNNQSFAGLLTLSATQIMCFELVTYVPVGFFVKLRTTSSGTASFLYQRGTEVLGF